MSKLIFTGLALVVIIMLLPFLFRLLAGCLNILFGFITFVVAIAALLFLSSLISRFLTGRGLLENFKRL